MRISTIRIAFLSILPVLLFLGAWAGLAAPTQVPSLVGGFQRHDNNVSDFQIASAPSLVVGSLTGDLNNPLPFVAFAQRNFGQPFQDIFVRSFNAATNRWVTRGLSRNQGSLNFDRNVVASEPSIDLGGPIVNGYPTQLWTAWQEPVRTLDNKVNIFASKLIIDQTGEFWQIAGETGGQRGVPGVNFRTTENAANAALATGATTAGAASLLPWIAFDEFSPIARARQIFVAKGETASGPNIQGGLKWLHVGLQRNSIETTLNVDTSRDALRPDMVFSGQNNTVPWVVWFERGRGRQDRIFAARGVADASGQGGIRWEIKPDCNGNEQNCTLNRFPTRHAINPKIASGALNGEDPTQPRPWVVWQESDGFRFQIFVSKWDGTRFVPVGGPLNVIPFNNAYDPDIFFIGNVPHVAFTEDFGGFRLLHVKHLGDARPGRERWDLNDNASRGINVAVFNPAFVPSLHGTKTSPFVAWQENNRFSQEQLVFEARRVPEGQAWGSTNAPDIRAISRTHTLALNRVLPLAANPDGQPDKTTQIGSDIIGGVTITSSCADVDDWDNIKQIEFMLSDEDETIFKGRFDVATNRISVDDPSYPGSSLGNIIIGTQGATIETPNVILDVGAMTVESHGQESPSLDIKWVINFKRSTFGKELTQSLNIIFTPQTASKTNQGSTQQTGFFQVGKLNVVIDQIFLPHVIKQRTLR